MDARQGERVKGVFYSTETKQGRKGVGRSRKMAAVLKQVVGKDVAKKLTLEQRSEGEEGGTCVFIGKNCIPGGGNSPCKGPEVGSAWLPLQLYLGPSFPSHSHSLLAPPSPRRVVACPGADEETQVRICR